MALNPEEREAFLRRCPNAILGINRRSGGPQLSPIWYIWEDGRFLMSAGSRTAKIKALRRDPEATLCIDDPSIGQYVTVYGRVELVEGSAVREPTLRLCEKYMPADRVAAHWEALAAEDSYVLIVFHPERMLWPDW